MGNILWLSGLVAAAVLVLQASGSRPYSSASPIGPDARTDDDAAILAYAQPAIGEPLRVELDVQSSALATAAFGMAALQPETYDKDMVLEIIDASPLAEIEKTQLVAGLSAVEIGNAELDRVLLDVRVALAVE